MIALLLCRRNDWQKGEFMGSTENTYGETTVDNLMEILKQYEKEREEKDE